MKRNQKILLIILGLLVIVEGGWGAYQWHHRHTSSPQSSAMRHLQKRTQSRTTKQTAFTKTKDELPAVTRLLHQQRFVGTALIVDHGRVVYQRGFGYADQARQVHNGPRSRFQILSIQKSLTAVGIMQLVQQGRVKLSDPVSKYYPQLKHGRQTTLRQMLDMTTGFRLNRGADQPASEAQVVDYAVRHVSYNPAKDGVNNYSSVNFLLLAGIIRQVSGKSYRHFFDRQIIQRCGLTASGFVVDGLAPHATVGYRPADATDVAPTYQQRMPETKAQMANELGTGQTYMSASDLFTVERAILRGKVVSKPNVAILHTRTATGEYGGGVYNISNGIRSHGVGYGYEADIHLSPDGNTGVVLLSNYYRKNASIEKAAGILFDRLLAGEL
ncbi:serine hydrolase domain-containing protein [Lactiplantibacillus modestisalitolerans]|uniref:Serine hydrolase domain-containing protein n=1 Tax=Lactiplantibacillus modestisalitolerans TaxID=1457219 RepID=A0ABV5WT45_9LACO|nr:serine hydrolase domain-containing protein [Lactiplantibacillus modestisalitolerans]